MLSVVWVDNVAEDKAIIRLVSMWKVLIWVENVAEIRLALSLEVLDDVEEEFVV